MPTTRFDPTKSSEVAGASGKAGAAGDGSSSKAAVAPTPGAGCRIYLGDVVVPILIGKNSAASNVSDYAFPNSKLKPGEPLALKFLSALQASQDARFKAKVAGYVKKRTIANHFNVYPDERRSCCIVSRSVKAKATAKAAGNGNGNGNGNGKQAKDVLHLAPSDELQALVDAGRSPYLIASNATADSNGDAIRVEIHLLSTALEKHLDNRGFMENRSGRSASTQKVKMVLNLLESGMLTFGSRAAAVAAAKPLKSASLTASGGGGGGGAADTSGDDLTDTEPEESDGDDGGGDAGDYGGDNGKPCRFFRRAGPVARALVRMASASSTASASGSSPQKIRADETSRKAKANGKRPAAAAAASRRRGERGEGGEGAASSSTLPTDRADFLDPTAEWAAEVPTLMEAIIPPDDLLAVAEQPAGLMVPMLPFQKQALYWMLQREEGGVEVGTPNPLWTKCFKLPPQDKVPQERRLMPEDRANGLQDDYLLVSEDNCLSLLPFEAVRPEPGGALAEEMGLGKTIEVLALVISRPRSEENGGELADPSRSRKLMRELAPERRPAPVGATLIISPLQIQSQWVDETKVHAPQLAVYVYPGVKRVLSGGKPSCYADRIAAAKAEIARADIVFTTYSILSEDLLYSEQRQQLGLTMFSPLLQVQWWRICLDEAQMVHDTQSKGSIMASELWRVNGWCVTGTPISNSINDLHGLLVFLDHDPFASKSALDRVLLRPYLRRDPAAIVRMRAFVSSVVWRHSKKSVHTQFDLPPLEEQVLTAVLHTKERTLYDTTLKESHRKVESRMRKIVAKRNRHKRTDGTYTGPKGLGFTVDVAAALEGVRKACNHPSLVRARRGGLINAEKMSVGDAFKQLHDRAKAGSESKAIAAEIATYDLARAIIDNAGFKSAVTAVAGRDWFDISKNARRNRAQIQFGVALTESDDDETVTRKVFKALAAKNGTSDDPASLDADQAEAFELLEKTLAAIDAHLKTMDLHRHEAVKATFEAADGQPMSELGNLPKWFGLKISVLRTLVEQQEAGKGSSSSTATPVAGGGSSGSGSSGVGGGSAAGSASDDQPKPPGKRRAVSSNKGGGSNTPVPRPVTPTLDAPVQSYTKRRDELTVVLAAHQPRLLEIQPDAMASFVGRDLRSGTAADHVASAIPVKHKSIREMRVRCAARERELSEAQSRVRHIQNQAEMAAKAAADKTAALQASTAASSNSGGGGPADTGDGNGGGAAAAAAVAPHKVGKVGKADDGDVGNEEEDEEQNCVICLDLMDNPVLTPCSHMFCEECLSEHLKRADAGSKACPTCRTPLALNDLMKVDMDPQPEQVATSDGDSLATQYGSKIAALIRDLQRRIAEDPDFKAVVFSAWSGFVQIVSQALTSNKISCAIISSATAGATTSEILRGFRMKKKGSSSTGGGGRGGGSHGGGGGGGSAASDDGAEKNPEMPKVLLLSLKTRQGAAGLTLTAANCVYLLDPSTNFGLEDQAVARIHRIGQTKPTTVVRIVAADTVEDKVVAYQQKKRAEKQARGKLAVRELHVDVLQMFGMEQRAWFKARFPEVFDDNGDAGDDSDDGTAGDAAAAAAAAAGVSASTSNSEDDGASGDGNSSDGIMIIDDSEDDDDAGDEEENSRGGRRNGGSAGSTASVATSASVHALLSANWSDEMEDDQDEDYEGPSSFSFADEDDDDDDDNADGMSD